MLKKMFGIAGASLLVPSLVLAQAVPVDVSAAVDQIETMGATQLAIGGALLVVAAIAVAIKWAKAATFG